MKKTLLPRIAILLLMISTLAGCILVPVDDGYGRRGDDHHRGDRGEHRGERR
ncbi:MAG: hypothetical protein ACYDHC_09035 [Desulfuromonadaceae bacterium]